MVTRLLVTLFLGKVHNLITARKEGSMRDLDTKTQLIMVAAGLRGPVALALVTQMPTASGERFLAAVYFVIFWSNLLFGGLTVKLVQFLGIRNEVDGSLDLAEFEFTEEEANYLEILGVTFARIEEVLLTHMGQKRIFSTSDRGRHAALWEDKVVKARARGDAKLTDRISKMPQVKKAQRALDKARADKMPTKSEAARTMIIKDLEHALDREKRSAARYILDSSAWDMTQGVSEASRKAEKMDTDNPVFDPREKRQEVEEEEEKEKVSE